MTKGFAPIVVIIIVIILIIIILMSNTRSNDPKWFLNVKSFKPLKLDMGQTLIATLIACDYYFFRET